MAEVENLARDIRDARRDRVTYELVPGPIEDMAMAYAVQDRLVSLLAEEQGGIAGWKLGMTTAKMQALTGSGGPAAGAILARRVHASGSTLAAGDFMHMGLEGEIALRVGMAFPESEAVDPAQAAQHIDGVAAAFEISDDRRADWTQLRAAPLIADNVWNAGIVLGPITPVKIADGLAGRRGIVRVNGVVTDQGMSQDIGCDALELVSWLAAHVARRGMPLQPGQWIMTGSFVPTRFPRPGDHYQFTVDGLAPVDVTVI